MTKVLKMKLRTEPPNRPAMKQLLSQLIDDIALIEATAEIWAAAAPGYAEMARDFKEMRELTGYWYHRPPKETKK